MFSIEYRISTRWIFDIQTLLKIIFALNLNLNVTTNLNIKYPPNWWILDIQIWNYFQIHYVQAYKDVAKYVTVSA